MANEQWVDRFVHLTLAARPAPSAGFEARALAAMAAARPRRHPSLVTIIIVAALILLLAASLFAAVRYFFYVEGTLHFHETRHDPAPDWSDVSARYFSGELEWETEPDVTLLWGDISPDGTRVVHGAGGEWPPGPGSDGPILVSNLDGSGQINLTEIAGIGGVNCNPKWSPDGTMVAFIHSDPVEGELPCEAGWYLWVMSAQGSGAHQVTPDGGPSIYTGFTWSPDSSRLAAHRVLAEGGGAFTTDIWGRDIRALPNVGTDLAWSPDGSMFASVRTEWAEVDGQPGCWNELLLTNADGSDPRVLVRQFVKDADVLANVARHGDLPEERTSELHGRQLKGGRYWAGPSGFVWSPDSTKIAFRGALPLDPDGPYYKDQVEVWVYDLDTYELIRVTDDDVCQNNIIWK